MIMMIKKTLKAYTIFHVLHDRGFFDVDPPHELSTDFVINCYRIPE
jgi:hypothetical protein